MNEISDQELLQQAYKAQQAARNKLDKEAPQEDEQGFLGDAVDAFQYGVISGGADLADAGRYIGGSETAGNIADSLRESANGQLSQMSTSGRDAMQKFAILDDDGEFSMKGLGLNVASMIGGLVPTMIPGGLAAKGLSAAGKVAGATGKVAKATDIASDAAGFGLVGGAASGGSVGNQAYETIMSATPNELKEAPAYREQYLALREQGADHKTAMYQARENVARTIAGDAAKDGALLGAVTQGALGPVFGKLFRGEAGSLSKSISTGALAESGQEFVESGGQRMIANANVNNAIPTELTDGALNDAVTGAVLGGIAGGAFGGAGRLVNRNPNQATDEDVIPEGQSEASARADELQAEIDQLDEQLQNDSDTLTDEEYAALLQRREALLREQMGEADQVSDDNQPFDMAGPQQSDLQEPSSLGLPAPNQTTVIPERVPPNSEAVSYSQINSEDAFLDVPSLRPEQRQQQEGRERRTNQRTEFSTPQQSVIAEPYQPTETELAARETTRRSFEEPVSEPRQSRKARDEAYQLKKQQEQELERGRQEQRQRQRNAQRRNQENQVALGQLEVGNEVKAAKGAKAKAYTPSNKPLDVEYQIVEASDLTTSHDDNFQARADYPQALQNRDRSSPALRKQVEDNAKNLIPEKLGEDSGVVSGAPIVRNGVVESGNGRTMSIRRAYNDNGAANYRQYLEDNAERLGINKDDLSQFNQPVLVRQRLSDMTAEELTSYTKDANTTDAFALNPVEQAKSDANRVSDDDMSLIDIPDSGDFAAASNRAFVRKFLSRYPKAEQNSMLNGDGTISEGGINRIQNAIFAKAYGSDQLIEDITTTSADDMKTIAKALTNAAPEVAKLNAQGGVDGFTDTIVNAVNLVKRSRRDGTPVQELTNQFDLMSENTVDPATASLANFLDQNVRSIKRMTDAIKGAAQRGQEAKNRSQSDDLFGPVPEPTTNDLLNFDSSSAAQTGKQISEAGKSSPEISEENAENGKENIKLAVSGKPFATEKSARLSRTFANTLNAEVVPVEGGFGVRDGSVKEEPQGTAQSVQSSNIPPSAISGSSSTERVDAQPTKFKPSDFVVNSKGEDTFGEISQDVADAIKRQAAPIKLEHGNAMWGLEHIKRPQRVSEIESMGYASVEEFVEDVGTNFNEIRKGDHGTLLLVKRNGKDKVAYVKLKPSKDGDFYSVSSATLARKQYIDKKERLWGRAPSNQQSPVLPNAVSGQSLSESVAETPAQQSSKEELPVRVAESDVEIIEDGKAESQSSDTNPSQEETKSVDIDSPNSDGGFDIERTATNIRVYGNPKEIRQALRSAGVHFPGSEFEGGVSFGHKLEDKIRNALDVDPNLSVGDNIDGMKADDVRAAVEPLINDLHERGTFQVVQSVNDLPFAIRLQAKAKLKKSKGENPVLRGINAGDKNYLIADGLRNEKEAIEIFLHEVVGHKAVLDMLGKDGDAIMERIALSYGRKGLEDLIKTYGVEPNTKEGRILLGKEKVAHMAERGEKPTLLKSLVAKVKSWLRNYFPSIKWSDNDVMSLISNARDNVENRYMTKLDLDAETETSAQEDSIHLSIRGDANPKDVNDIIGRTQAKPEHQKGLMERAADRLKVFKEIDKTAMKQAFIDSYAAIESLEKKVNFGKLMDGAESAYKAALRTANLDSQVEAVMRRGALKYENGAFQIKEGTKGFLEIFQKIADSDQLQLWETWAGAKRAKRIMEEDARANLEGQAALKEHRATINQLKKTTPANHPGGLTQWRKDMRAAEKGMAEARTRAFQKRERLYKPSDIQRVIKYVNDNPELKKEFEQAQSDWRKFNKSMLDMAEQAGLIDPEARAIWEHDDYVPFHRVAEIEADGGISQYATKRGLSGQKSGIKQLKGGVEKLNIIESMVRNVIHLVDASNKNVAMQRVVDLADGVAMEKLPTSKIDPEERDMMLREFGYEPESMDQDTLNAWSNQLERYNSIDKGVVSVSRNGKLHKYHVTDTGLFAAITQLGPMRVDGMLKILGVPKRVLTASVTAAPGFMSANFVRDTLSTWVTVEPKTTPVYDAIKGAAKGLRRSETQWAIMAAGAGGGGYYDTSPDSVRQHLSPLNKGGALHKPKQLWDAWMRVGQALENANRIAVYESVVRDGGTVAEAAHQAQDVINFSKRGAHKWVQGAITLIPFLNARIQGLERLYRGAKENPKAFFMKGAILMGASLALLATNWDNEEYWELDEWDRDANWHIFAGGEHFKIPKPFEVGAFFGTVPERVFEQLRSDASGKLLAERMLAMVTGTFAFDPFGAQVIKPGIDVMRNKNGFTGNPILGFGDQFRSPEGQYSPWTSETMKQLAEAMPDSAPEWMRSPKTLEYLFKGYFGTLGGYALSLTDAATQEIVGAPDQPDTTLGRYPVVKRFYSDELTGNKHVGRFYDMAEEVNAIYSDMKTRFDDGQSEQATKLMNKNIDKLRLRSHLNKVRQQMSDISSQIRMVYMDTKMSSTEKRRRIDKLTKRRNQIARAASLQFYGVFN